MEKGPQNSPLRKFTKNPTEKVAVFLTDKFPWMTANLITKVGFGTVAAGGILAAIPENMFSFDFTPVAVALMAVGSGFDGIDGPMARVQNTAGIEGAMLDLKADRMQETALALSRIVKATARRDVLGIITAASAGISNPFPSWLRAEVEALGYFVPESGAKPISFLGTRAMRAVFGITATGFSDISIPQTEQSIQPLLDTVSAFSNIYTTYERANILMKAKKGELTINPDQKAKELGALKSKELEKYIVLNTLVMFSAATIGIINTLNS